LQGAPSKPSFLNTEKNLAELKLKLRWSKPDDDGGNSDIEYEVSIMGYEDGKLVQNETVDKKTKELEMELDSRYVKAGRTYYFKVTAINEGGKSEAGSLRVTVDKNAGTSLDTYYFTDCCFVTCCHHNITNTPFTYTIHH